MTHLYAGHAFLKNYSEMAFANWLAEVFLFLSIILPQTFFPNVQKLFSNGLIHSLVFDSGLLIGIHDVYCAFLFIYFSFIPLVILFRKSQTYLKVQIRLGWWKHCVLCRVKIYVISVGLKFDLVKVQKLMTSNCMM